MSKIDSGVYFRQCYHGQRPENRKLRQSSARLGIARGTVAARKKTPQHRSVGGLGVGPCTEVHVRRDATNLHMAEQTLLRGELIFTSSDTALSEDTFLADLVQVNGHLAISAVSLAFLLGWP